MSVPYNGPVRGGCVRLRGGHCFAREKGWPHTRQALWGAGREWCVRWRARRRRFRRRWGRSSVRQCTGPPCRRHEAWSRGGHVLCSPRRSRPPPRWRFWEGVRTRQRWSGCQLRHQPHFPRARRLSWSTTVSGCALPRTCTPPRTQHSHLQRKRDSEFSMGACAHLCLSPVVPCSFA